MAVEWPVLDLRSSGGECWDFDPAGGTDKEKPTWRLVDTIAGLRGWPGGRGMRARRLV